MKRIFVAALALFFCYTAYAYAEEITEYDRIDYLNTCEMEAEGLILREGAPDGSSYYSYTPSENTDFTFDGIDGNTSEYYIWEADIRFEKSGSGFTVMSSGKSYVNTCVRRYDEADGTTKLAVQTGGSSYAKYDIIDPKVWYNIQLIGKYGTDEPLKMCVYRWENGKKIFVSEYNNVNKRNNEAASYIALRPNTSIDNIRIIKPSPDNIEIMLPYDIINAGESVQAEYSVTRLGKELEDFSIKALEWEIYDETNTFPLDDASVTIDSSGQITADTTADDRLVFVRVTSRDNDVYSFMPLTIKAKEIFTVKDVVFNSGLGAIEKITVDKNFEYNGKAVFILTFYDENGALISARVRHLNGNLLQVGENTIDIDMLKLPDNFHKLKVMVWSRL